MNLCVKKRRLAGLGLMLALLVGVSASAAAADEARPGRITLDGAADDWDLAQVESVSVSGGQPGVLEYTGWRVARDEENVYLCVEGMANEYVNGDSVAFSFTQSGRTTTAPVSFLCVPKDSWGAGATYSYACNANSRTTAPYVLEVAIPADYFTDPNYIITFCESSAQAATIPLLNGEEVEGPETEPPVYEGIQMDGRFGDWAAVTKYPGNDPNGTVDEAAMVFDGDAVYIYIQDAKARTAAGAGPQSTGKFAITTDLGRPVLFQLTADDRINGIEGAEAIHVGHQWEICVPRSELPPYKETLSFGVYLQEPMVENVANVDGSAGSVTEEFEGVVVDGKYGDWLPYPHTIIEYATQGTADKYEDCIGALYVADGKIYSHVETSMTPHLGAQGGDFLAGITVAFNGERWSGPALRPVMRYEGEDTIVNERTGLEQGTYTFDIYDASTANWDKDWKEQPKFGKMKVTINGYRDELELELDMDAVAEFLGLSKSDMKLVEINYGRLGDQWLSAAGTSSGPWLWLLVILPCLALVWYQRQKKQKARG